MNSFVSEPGAIPGFINCLTGVPENEMLENILRGTGNALIIRGISGMQNADILKLL